MNRREFLRLLLDIGAAIALPIPIADASPAQVDAAWDQLLKRPWVFNVNDYGTILDEDDWEPKTRGEVFDVEVDRLRSIRDVQRAIEGCNPLTARFRWLAYDRLAEIDQRLARGGVGENERERLEALADLMRDHFDDAWTFCLDDEPDVERFKGVIRGWLDEPVNWSESDWFDVPGTSVSRAKGFFEHMPLKLLDALGVVIVEGEHPGSSYYAAELRGDIDAANAVAAERALPFRFARAG